MTLREEALKTEIKEWDQAMQTSTSLVAEISKQQDETIKEISASVLNAVEEVKKEKAKTTEALQAIKVLKKSLEMGKAVEAASKKALDGLCKDNLDLESQVDTLKAKPKMFEDLLAQEQAEKAKQIDDAKGEATDTAWYRLWLTNLGVLDLSFLEDDLEPMLARWNARLEQVELETVTEAASSDDEEVDSQGLQTSSARLDAIRREVTETFAAKEDASTLAEPNLAHETAEGVPTTEDIPDPHP